MRSQILAHLKAALWKVDSIAIARRCIFTQPRPKAAVGGLFFAVMHNTGLPAAMLVGFPAAVPGLTPWRGKCDGAISYF
jgi:hypothetical protein